MGTETSEQKKNEWTNNRETELCMLEEEPQVNIQPDRIKGTLKKIAYWKTPGIKGIHGF